MNAYFVTEGDWRGLYVAENMQEAIDEAWKRYEAQDGTWDRDEWELEELRGVEKIGEISNWSDDKA